jgi:hypothetical protein
MVDKNSIIMYLMNKFNNKLKIKIDEYKLIDEYNILECKL